MATYEIVKFDKAGLMLELAVTVPGEDQPRPEMIHGPFLDHNDEPIDIENGMAVDAWARDWVDERYDPESFSARPRTFKTAARPENPPEIEVQCFHCANKTTTTAAQDPPDGWTKDGGGRYSCPEYWRDYLENGIVRRGPTPPATKEPIRGLEKNPPRPDLDGGAKDA